MYLRTPKRYQTGRKRRHLFGSLRWLWLWILTPIIVFLGYQIYERRDEFGPPVREFVDNAISDARSGISTVVAPTPLPTSDPTQRIVRAGNLWAQGAIEQAISEYELAREGAPNDIGVHYFYTYGLLIEGRLQEALEAAEDTVTANPFSSDAWAIRALALSRNGRQAEAIASAMQALSLNPNNATAMAFQGQAYVDAGQPGLAEDAINRALSNDPDNFEAHYARGLWNLAANFDSFASHDDLEIAYDLAPNMPSIAVELAWAKWRIQDYDEGYALLEDVLELNANNLDALYAIGYMNYQVYNEPNKAEDYLSRCVQNDPDNLSCLDYLAIVQLGLQNVDAALETYRRLIATGTQNPIYFLRAGRTFANAGDCRTASPMLRTGYDLEQQQASPNMDRLIAFEDFMIGCNVPFNPVYSSGSVPETSAEAEVTEEAVEGGE